MARIALRRGAVRPKCEIMPSMDEKMGRAVLPPAAPRSIGPTVFDTPAGAFRVCWRGRFIAYFRDAFCAFSQRVCFVSAPQPDACERASLNRLPARSGHL